MRGFIVIRSGDVLAVILPAAAVHSGHPPAAVMVLLDVNAAVNAHSHTLDAHIHAPVVVAALLLDTTVTAAVEAARSHSLVAATAAITVEP